MDIRKKMPRMSKEEKERIKGEQVTRRKPKEPVVLAPIPIEEDTDEPMGATE